jgi:hypothetical protein
MNGPRGGEGLFFMGVLRKIWNFSKALQRDIPVLIRITRKLLEMDSFSRTQIDRTLNDGCREPASQFEKLTFLQGFTRPTDIWVETGTYMGFTASGLAAKAKTVYTFEPSPRFFEISRTHLSKFSNISQINEASEDALEGVLREIHDGSSVKLWLDGHFSGGETFLGTKSSPIEAELSILDSHLGRLDVLIFIDDFRHFGVEEGYPVKSFLVDWAEKRNLPWTVERDIFICGEDALSRVR